MSITPRVLAVFLLSSVAVRAQAVPDPSGHWEGTIQTPQMAIAVEVDLMKNGEVLAGTINVPPQNLKGFPLVIEGYQGRSIAFRLRGTPGNRVFQGKLSEDGTSIAGDFTQSGYTVPFALTRTGAARLDPPVRSPGVSRQLEGPWSAILDGNYPNGIPRRIILTLSNQPDGTSTGSVVNVGEGLEIPIASITQQDSTVTLDLRAVGGTYSGTVNAEGTELIGSFIQGTTVLPLTFRRSPPTENGR